MKVGDLVALSIERTTSPIMIISSIIDDKNAVCIWISNATQELQTETFKIEFLKKVSGRSSDSELEINVGKTVTLISNKSPHMIVISSDKGNFVCQWISETTGKLQTETFKTEFLKNLQKISHKIDLSTAF